MYFKKIKKFFFLLFFIFGFAGLIDMQTPGLSFADFITFGSTTPEDLSSTPLAEDFSEHEHSPNQENLSDDDSPNDDCHLFYALFNLKAFLQKTYDGDSHTNHPEPITDNLVPPPEQQV